MKNASAAALGIMLFTLALPLGATQHAGAQLILGPPMNLMARAASTTQINLSWSPPANLGGLLITGYKIDRSTNGGSAWSTVVYSTGNAQTTYSNTGLVPGTTYWYRVSAITIILTSAPSNTASATTLSPVTPPGAPTGLVASGSNSQVMISWQAPSSNGGSAITGYNVYRGTSPGGEGSGPIATGVASTRYTDTSVSNGQTYYYEVRAVNSAGAGGASNEASATPATVPGAPTGLVASGSNSQVMISWQAPSSSGGATITSYNIYRGTSPGGEGGVPLTIVSGSARSYADTSVANGQAYYYTVSASNSAGEGPKSNEASATPSAPLTPPPAGAAAANAVHGYAVQVSSQRSEADAEASFRALQAKYPQQLGGRQPVIRRADLGAKGVYYRAMVGPFANGNEATSLCSALKAAGGSCIIQKN